MNNKKISSNSALFGQRLRILRKTRHISQKKLSEKCGYKRSTSMSNIEKGNAPVHISSLIVMADLLDIDLHWLITGKPSLAVIRLKPYATCHLVERYQEVHDLEKERSELLVKRSLGEVHLIRLNEIKEEIENRRLYCQTVRKVLNEVLEPLGEIL
jgi:transcriptional regulator with XRE-family HTH domain